MKELIGQSGKGSCAIVICSIQRVHAHTAILRKTDSGSDHNDLRDYKPISRLGGNDYARTHVRGVHNAKTSSGSVDNGVSGSLASRCTG